jgi:hypothetical protein
MKDQGADLDRRTAKMRDMKDKLRAVIGGPGVDAVAAASQEAQA